MCALQVRKRRAATVAEFTVVAPVLFLIVMAVFQFGGLMMAQNVMTAAAREGSRVGALPGTSSSVAVITAVKDRLRLGGVDPDLVTVVVSPSTLDGLARGTEVRVTLAAPISQVAFFWPEWMTPNHNLSTEMTFHRE